MRSGVWLVLLGLTLLGSCSGGYPLPPTRCDEFCDATKGATCEKYYDPASCVVHCEEADVDIERCSAQLDVALSCFRNSRNVLAQRCVHDNAPDDCDHELGVLMGCVGGYSYDDLAGDRTL